jgi:hypothetical protein
LHATVANAEVVATRSKARPRDRRLDRKTGKRVRARVEPDKKLHIEGDGAPAWGLMFEPIHTRTPHGRVILDIPYVPAAAPKHEADVAVDTLRLLRPLPPGAHFHVHDGAMTAAHNQSLLTEQGTVLVNRPRAKSNPKVKGHWIGQRVPDDTLVEVKLIERPDGQTERLEIYQVDGQLGVNVLKEDGEHLFLPMKTTRMFMNRNRSEGSHPYRPYVGLKLPAEVALRVGKRDIQVAIHDTEEDKRRGYLRTAHVRAIGPANPDFAIYRQMRGDSESLNRTIEDSLYRHHRAHSVGWARQQVDMLGLASLINALTRERMRRQRLPAAA